MSSEIYVHYILFKATFSHGTNHLLWAMGIFSINTLKRKLNGSKGFICFKAVRASRSYCEQESEAN
jgi:hypothetical protein